MIYNINSCGSLLCWVPKFNVYGQPEENKGLAGVEGTPFFFPMIKAVLVGFTGPLGVRIVNEAKVRKVSKAQSVEDLHCK